MDVDVDHPSYCLLPSGHRFSVPRPGLLLAALRTKRDEESFSGKIEPRGPVAARCISFYRKTNRIAENRSIR